MEYILELDMQVVNDFTDEKEPKKGIKDKVESVNRNIRAAKEGN